VIIPRAEHNISRGNINSNALKVLYRLKEAGYEAYLVGGGVRDLLLGREPKDFDVATSALPDEVRAQFKQCRLVGRRFRLAHVGFGRDVVEVATFRASPTEENGDSVVIEEDGRILRDNAYGNMVEDAFRRDFTVNALYYNIRDFSVVDYADGLADLRAGVLRLIGDPALRYREDPVRMLRAVRFSVKLGFRLDPETERPLAEMAHLLLSIPAARLFEEVMKLFMSGCAVQIFEALRHYGLFKHLFPATDFVLASEQGGFPRTFVVQALANTDARIQQEKPVTPAFLFATLLWEPMRRRVEGYLRNGEQEFVAFQQAAQEIVREQGQVVSFPKRFSIPMREIWAMQSRLQRTGGRAPQRLMTHPRFRAAYDFLLLRAQAGEDLQPLCDFWTKLQENPEHERAPTTELEARGPRRRRRRRGGSRSRESTDPLPVSSADSSEEDDAADDVVDEFDEEGEE